MNLQELLTRTATTKAREAQVAPGRLLRLLGIAKAVPVVEGPPPVPVGMLSRLVNSAAAEKEPQAFAEIQRICRLPVVDGYPSEERQVFQTQNVLAQHYDRGFRLHDVQVDAVLTYRHYGGVFGPIGVGWGKTAVTLLIAAEAFRKGLQRSVLFIPPQVLDQLWAKDIPWARNRLVLHGVPFHLVAGSSAQRRAVASSGKRGCYVFPYSMLSTTDASATLELIRPQLVILDEAHNVKARDAARTKRLLKYVDTHKPEIVALSGTITSKSVLDYHHLVKPLGELCPLPLKTSLVYEWSYVLDSDAEVTQHNVGPIRPLLEWARKQPNAPDCPPNATGFRRAFRHRLATAPCTVATSDQEIGTSLTICNRPVARVVSEATEGWQALQAHLKVLEEEWKTPDGDELEHQIHVYKWAFEFASGFYNSLVWPSVVELAKRRGIDAGAATDLLEIALEHYTAQQRYHKELRGWLGRHNRTGLDTPLLVAQSLAKHGAKEVGDEALFAYWQEARRLKQLHPDMPERDSVVRRVCPFKVNHVLRWCSEVEDGIVWYYHQGIGDWIAETLTRAQVPHLHCPAGKAHDKAITESEGRIVVASVSAHGTGKNLQFHRNQVFVQFPRPAHVAEQAIGRTHRFGQDADDLTVETMIQPDYYGAGRPSFEELSFAACLNDALYIQQTTGLRQKVIYCNYDPTPKVFPSEVLRERGLENRMLTKDQQAVLNERFGVQ